MQSEQQPRRRPTMHFFPPCERYWLVHLRDGEPIGLVIDDKPYTVLPRRRGKGIREGDQLVYVVDDVSNYPADRGTESGGTRHAPG